MDVADVPEQIADSPVWAAGNRTVELGKIHGVGERSSLALKSSDLLTGV
jgi:hypothetical protein